MQKQRMKAAVLTMSWQRVKAAALNMCRRHMKAYALRGMQAVHDSISNGDVQAAQQQPGNAPDGQRRHQMSSFSVSY